MGVIVIFALVWLMHWGRRKAVGSGRVKWSSKDFENLRAAAAGRDDHVEEMSHYTKQVVSHV